ncbi:hypothetical protein JL722_1152 [Aureococcus anophagefferens]|nr:hypothetical protein JL722_1152 [Aureococcus anophagefferens]
MRRLLRLAAALLVAVASGDTAPPPEEPEPMASSNTLGGEFIVAAAAAPEPDAEEVDAAGEAAAAFEARRAALSEAMAPPDDYDAGRGRRDGRDPPRAAQRPAAGDGGPPRAGAEARAPPIAEGDTMARLEDLLARGQADAAAEAAALEAQKARRKNDPAYEARRAQAWGELSPWERRRCDDEVDRVRKLADRGHYAVLGLRRSAPAAAVKQKYRQKALLVHPDKNPSPDAQLAFDALREAHETLGDEAKRRDYDRRMRRKAEVRRQRIVREVRAIVETAAEYVAYRSRDAPKLFYSAMAVAFLLV